MLCCWWMEVNLDMFKVMFYSFTDCTMVNHHKSPCGEYICLFFFQIPSKTDSVLPTLKVPGNYQDDELHFWLRNPESWVEERSNRLHQYIHIYTYLVPFHEPCFWVAKIFWVAQKKSLVWGDWPCKIEGFSCRFFKVTPFGTTRDLSKRAKSDLHLGNQRVRLKKLVFTLEIYICQEVTVNIYVLYPFAPEMDVYGSN